MSALLGGFTVQPQVVFDGVVLGMVYGILAVGLVLVFRSTRVINFAHGQMGVFGAAVLALFVAKYDINFYVALAAVLVIGAAVGAGIELIVVRRLFNAPRVILFVATLGVTQLLLLFQFLLPRLGQDANQPFPTPLSGVLPPEGWTPFGDDIRIRSAHVMVLAIVPVLTVALAFFLQRTKFGTAIRAAADNPDAARTSTINIKTMSTLVWILAGLLATITAVLVAPLRGSSVSATAALGPSLILRALAAALVGRMRSMPLAVVGGIAIGVGEKLLFYNNPSEPGILDAVLFVVVLVSVLAVSRSARDDEGSRSMSFAPRIKPVPAALQRFWFVRRMQVASMAVALLIGILIPFILTKPSQQLTFSRMLIYAIVALSLTVLTGWAGQLSLGQFAFVGLGAFLTAALVRGMTFDVFGEHLELGHVPFEASIVVVTIVVTVVAMIVGVPALRIRGLFLAVTTLAFAVMATSWLLERPFFLGGETFVRLDLPEWLSGAGGRRAYYYLCLAAAVLVAGVLWLIRQSGIGRSLVAVRDNEQGAAAFTISPTRMKMMAFGVAGALAGLAGVLFAGYQVQYGTNAFPPEESLAVVAIAVIGGLSSVSGAFLGALWVVGLPAIFGETEQIRFFTSGAGLLILLLYFPGGLVQRFIVLRDFVLSAIARRLPPTEPIMPAQMPIPARVVDAADLEALPEGVPALVTRGVSVRFGQRVVVDEVDLEVRRGEVVGLIGTNGAGKTTLMDAVGGYIASTGRIEVLGREVTGLSAPRRASAGLGRTWQTADLFPDLTVLETVQVSLEARHRATLPATVLALPNARRLERRKRAEADELIAFFGLGRYQDHCIDELSTGTRRIVELACLIGVEARVLCLDEPTAGVAQRETEAFAPLVLRIREELGASVLVVEHDMPFIMGISDRVYCMEAGRIIAEGVPHEVRNDDAVISSYLGTDQRAIDRSDAVEPAPRT
jgi:ABC-type branched-subunit amino acid transport system permease subunit/ABC-type branched-subunit amino acid transport system ATPase component